MEERWVELLRLLRQDGGVRRAAQLIASRQGSVRYSHLWMLIPELLAREVVLLDCLQPRNCLWIETLPSSMQTVVLTFISLHFTRFRTNDLLLLCKRLLEPENDVDFWVRRAAQRLFYNCSGSTAPQQEASDFDEIPEFLKENSAPEEAQPRFDNEALDDNNKTIDPGRVEAEVDDEEQGTGDEDDYWNLKVSEDTVLDEDDDQEEESNTPNEIDLADKASALKQALRNFDHGDAGAIDEQLASFRNVSELSAAVTRARPWEMDDKVTLVLVTKLLDEGRSFKWCSSVMKALLLPKLVTVQNQPASRLLYAAALQASKCQPRAFVEAVLVPLMTGENGGVTPQLSELVGRLTKEGLEEGMVLHLCRRLFLGSKSLVWSDAIAMAMHSVLSSRVRLDSGVLEGIVASLEQGAMELPGSLKFANLVLCLLTLHGSRLGSFKQRLQELIASTDTFMTDTLASKAESILRHI